MKLFWKKRRVKFDGSYLKQVQVTFTHGKIINTYIVYEISVYESNNIYATLEYCLFGAVKLYKKGDIDK